MDEELLSAYFSNTAPLVTVTEVLKHGTLQSEGRKPPILPSKKIFQLNYFLQYDITQKSLKFGSVTNFFVVSTCSHGQISKRCCPKWIEIHREVFSKNKINQLHRIFIAMTLESPNHNQHKKHIVWWDISHNCLTCPLLTTEFDYIIMKEFTIIMSFLPK